VVRKKFSVLGSQFSVAAGRVARWEAAPDAGFTENWELGTAL